MTLLASLHHRASRIAEPRAWAAKSLFEGLLVVGGLDWLLDLATVSASLKSEA
jgi:hypothetical protein